MSTPVVISFRFAGKLADAGELDLYQAGRYRYAAARLLYTLEDFRQHGRVLARLSTRVQADFRVSAPKTGSFIDPVVVQLAPLLADGFLRVPFEKVLAWAVDQILPKANQDERLVKLLDKSIDAQLEREKTAQSAERTRRAEIAASREQLALIRDLVTRQDRASDRELRRQVEGLPGAVANGVTDDVGSLGYALSELIAERNRTDELQSYEATLDHVVRDQLKQQLSSRLRRILPEIAYPLGQSAETFSLVSDNDNVPLLVVNETRVKQIKTLRDGQPVEVVGDITRFDKQTRHGRILLVDQRRPVTFSIDPAAPKHDRDAAIRAMLAERTRAVFVPVLDGTGTVVALKLQRILPLTT